jgi:hypothetical protein
VAWWNRSTRLDTHGAVRRQRACSYEAMSPR